MLTRSRTAEASEVSWKHALLIATCVLHRKLLMPLLVPLLVLLLPLLLDGSLATSVTVRVPEM